MAVPERVSGRRRQQDRGRSILTCQIAPGPESLPMTRMSLYASCKLQNAVEMLHWDLTIFTVAPRMFSESISSPVTSPSSLAK